MRRSTSLALAVLAVLTRAAAAEEPMAPPQRVLELEEANPELSPVYTACRDNLHAALPLGEKIELRTEAVDAARIRDPRYRATVRDRLASEYASSAPNLIVAVGQTALTFLASPDSLPWPDVPVVFGGIDERMPVLQRLPPRFTGIAEHLEVRGTIDLALALLPATRHLALFGGASERDALFADLLRAEAARYASRVNVVDLTGLPLSQLLDRVRAVPEHSILIGLSYIRDTEGRHRNVRGVVTTIAGLDAAPVFVVYRQGLDTGAIGGVVADYGETGRRAAELVLRVLGGEAPAAIPILRAGPYRAVLDGRVLDRWNVPSIRVPPGAEILFRDAGTWRRYRWHLLAAASALVLQTLLIAGLLMERRNRRAAERQVRENLLEVAHLNRVGAISELAGAFAHELNTPLGAALNNAAAARRFIARGPAGVDEAVACLNDIIEDVRRAGEVVKRIRSVLRRDAPAESTVDVAKVIHDAVRLVDTEARDGDVSLSTELAPDLPTVQGDEVQLVQVLLNLLLNAVHALRGVPRDGRRVSIAAVPADRGLDIQVRDTGPGIPVENAEKLFEPFFTTKAGGLGLGLAISRSIVQSHGGRLWVEPGQDRGTVFHVFLPTSQAAASTARADHGLIACPRRPFQDGAACRGRPPGPAPRSPGSSRPSSAAWRRPRPAPTCPACSSIRSTGSSTPAPGSPRGEASSR